MILELVRRRAIRMREMREEIIATIPQTTDDAMLEVAMTYDADHRARVELRYLTRANGIGWYRQKSLSLDASATDALLTSLGQVRRRLKTRGHARQDGKPLPFPEARHRPETPCQAIASEWRTEAVNKTCCERFKRKGRACKTCPTMARQSHKASQKLLKISQT
jgi:hypothetical protein